MKLALVTDAWTPQVNGVVQTLSHTIAELRLLGMQVEVFSSEGRLTVPCPGYPEIRLAVLAARRLRARLRDFGPDALHIATARGKTLLLCSSGSGVTCLADLTEQAASKPPEPTFAETLEAAKPFESAAIERPIAEPASLQLEDIEAAISRAKRLVA